MLHLGQQPVVRAIGVIREAPETLYLGVEILEIDEVKILVTSIVPTQAALIPHRHDPIMTYVILGSERVTVCDGSRKIYVEAGQTNGCAARGEVVGIKGYDGMGIGWEAVEVVRIA